MKPIAIHDTLGHQTASICRFESGTFPDDGGPRKGRLFAIEVWRNFLGRTCVLTYVYEINTNLYPNRIIYQFRCDIHMRGDTRGLYDPYVMYVICFQCWTRGHPKPQKQSVSFLPNWLEGLHLEMTFADVCLQLLGYIVFFNVRTRNCPTQGLFQGKPVDFLSVPWPPKRHWKKKKCQFNQSFVILLGISSIEYWGQCTYFIVPGLRSGLYRIETLDKPAPRKQYGFHFFFK